MTENLLDLADVITALRGNLMSAQAAGKDESLRFRLGDVEIEATVVVTREVSGKGGIRFWVVEAGGSGSKTDAATQRVKVTLHPATDFDVARPTPGPPS